MEVAHRPFRFGMQSGAGYALADPKAWVEHARTVEDLGYAVLLAPDHFGPWLSPMPALAAAAQVTTHLRLGTMVINQAWRHPAVLAKEAATVDLLSGGRLELGLGTGWIPREQEQVGIPFEPFAERFERFEEYVQIVKGLLRAEPFSFAGKYYQVTELDVLPRPVQPHGPPIMIGGYGQKVLSLAVREADIISFAGTPAPPGDPLETLAQRARLVRELAGQTESRPELSLNCGGAVPLGVDRREAARRMASESPKSSLVRPTRRLTEEMVLASPNILVGTTDQVVDKLVEQRERFGISYVTYLPSGDYRESVLAFAGVVARLAGT